MTPDENFLGLGHKRGDKQPSAFGSLVDEMLPAAKRSPGEVSGGVYDIPEGGCRCGYSMPRCSMEPCPSNLKAGMAQMELFSLPRAAFADTPFAPSEADCAALANVLTAPERGVPEATLRDMVDLPEHYARFPIEPIRFICENGLNFFQGNVLKYILRYDAKNGLEDLKKAQRYLAMFIKFVEKDPDWWKS